LTLLDELRSAGDFASVDFDEAAFGAIQTEESLRTRVLICSKYTEGEGAKRQQKDGE
jgi:hypothetical protein